MMVNIKIIDHRILAMLKWVTMTMLKRMMMMMSMLKKVMMTMKITSS